MCASSSKRRGGASVGGNALAAPSSKSGESRGSHDPSIAPVKATATVARRVLVGVLRGIVANSTTGRMKTCVIFVMPSSTLRVAPRGRGIILRPRTRSRYPSGARSIRHSTRSLASCTSWTRRPPRSSHAPPVHSNALDLGLGLDMDPEEQVVHGCSKVEVRWHLKLQHRCGFIEGHEDPAQDE